MKSILLLSALVTLGTATHSGFLQYQSSSSPKSIRGDWPPIKKVPDSFRIDIASFTYNNITQELESYKNTTSYQYVDSVGNREMTVSSSIVDGIGQTELGFYFDLTTGIVTYKIPAIGFCNYVPMNVTLNLFDLIKAVNDPEAGFATYDGLVQLPYAQHEMHQFTLTLNTSQGVK